MLAMQTDRPLSAAVSRDNLAAAPNTPLLDGDATHLDQPRAPYMAPSAPESPRNSSYMNTPHESATLLAPKREPYGMAASESTPPKRRRSPVIIALLALAALAVVAVAVVVPVYFTVIKKNNNNTAVSGGTGSNTGSGSGSGTSGGGTPNKPTTESTITGGDGSTVLATNGTKFTYVNKLGGICESHSFLSLRRRVFLHRKTLLDSAALVRPSIHPCSHQRFPALGRVLGRALADISSIHQGILTPTNHTATMRIPTPGLPHSTRAGTTILIASWGKSLNHTFGSAETKIMLVSTLVDGSS